jgi:CubicO group peptidase (beta-lactamase class C family)
VDSGLETDLNQLLTNANKGRFTGTLAVSSSEGVLFLKSVGPASVAHHLEVERATKFNIASMTKLFTTIAVAQLMEEGRVSLDDTVGDLLPNLDLGKIKQACERIRVEHLLTHTSGLETYFNDRFAERRETLHTLQDYVDLFKDDVPATQPGERFVYSNSGFVLLGAIVESCTSMSFADYLSRRIFNPTGMLETGFPVIDVDTPNLASGYTKLRADGSESDGQVRNNLLFLPRIGSPAGGAYSTVDDLLKFSRALEGSRLIKQDTKQSLLAKRVERNRPPFRFQGLGVCSDYIGARMVYGHGGGMPGANCILEVCPESDLTLVVVSNVDPPAAYDLATRAFPVVLDYME